MQLGQLGVHFLVTGDNSSGIAVFELIAAIGGARLMALAHSHNYYEETIYGVDGALTWTVGKPIEVHSGQASVSGDGCWLLNAECFFITASCLKARGRPSE